LIALYALTGASPALALDDAKLSKPLNLRSLAQTRGAAAQKPGVPVSALPNDNAAIRSTARVAEDTGPLVTGAAPAPDNPPAAARPARSGSGTAMPKP